MLYTRYSHDAQNDIQNIYDYTVNNWGIAKAKEYTFELRDKIRLLANNPHIGIPTKYGNIYKFPFYRHMVYFSFDHHSFYVIAVLHVSCLSIEELSRRV